MFKARAASAASRSALSLTCPARGGRAFSASIRENYLFDALFCLKQSV